MKTRLRMKCKACGHWNRIEANKLFIEQPTSEPKVKAYTQCMKHLKLKHMRKAEKFLRL